MLNIIFMGTPEFAVPSLKGLRAAGHRIALVVTNPDRRRSRGAPPEPTPVKHAAMALNLPVLEAESVSDPLFIEKIRSFNADLLVVVAFRMLPAEVIHAARLGSVNVHASLLPRYRGAAPIHHAILHGETETGCTVFQLDERMDTGGILIQRSIPIGADETTGDLYDRLKMLGAEILVEAVQGLESGTLRPRPQSDELATRAPKVGPEDGRIDATRPAREVHNRIRAMTPSPGAWMNHRGARLRLCRSRPFDPSAPPPGTAGLETPEQPLETPEHPLETLEQPLAEGSQPGDLTLLKGRPDRLLLRCGGGTFLELAAVQLPGRNVISGAEFARSNPLASGLAESD